MVALTIRNIDPALKRQIKMLAATHDRSMEAEAHELLKRALLNAPTHKNIGQSIYERAQSVGGIELEIEPRTEMPSDLPIFGE